MTLNLAVPDVVSFDYRRCSSPPEHRVRHLDGLSCSLMLPADGSSGRNDDRMSSTADFDPACRSVSADPDTRLVQSSVTGDWRFVTSTSSSPHPEVCDHPEVSGTRARPRRRRYGSVLPQDMGVGVSSDLCSSCRTDDVGTVTSTSSVCQVDLSLRASGTVLSSEEVADSLPDVHEYAADMVLTSSSSVSSTLTSKRCSPNIDGKDEISFGNAVSVLSGNNHSVAGVVKNSAPEVTHHCTSASPSEVELQRLPVLNRSATNVIQTSPSSVRSGNGVVLYSPDIATTDLLRCSESNVEVVKNCSLSTQFATDADLEADLLSSKLLREFREAIKSAVDSISSGRSHQDDNDLPCYVLPLSDFASAQGFVSVERAQKYGDSFESTPVMTRLRSHSMSDTRVEGDSESAVRRFRMSNIPTLNGVNRCRRSVVGDDLTTATHRTQETQNVLGRRRSLPDASQLRCLSSSTLSQDATFPSRTNVRMRSSLVIGAFCC